MNRRQVLLAALALPLPSRMALAAVPYGAALVGGMPAEGGYIAGVAISLEPEWKTYWRMPGEAGIPPSFDWSRSTNVANVEVLYPAPHRFSDASGEAVGYKHGVVFPLKVAPVDAAKPVGLAVDMFFAVCNEICIPARAAVNLSIGNASPPAGEMQEIETALQSVPKPADPPLITAAGITVSGGQALLLLDVAELADRIVDLFVESATSAYFRKPRIAGARQLALPVDGLDKPDELRGKPLKLTIIHADGALEQDCRVD